MRAVALLCGIVLVLSAPAARAASFNGLGYLPGDDGSSANAISAGGSVVVGGSGSQSLPNTPSQAFRWTASGGMVGLGDLPGGDFYSYANGVSGDGTVVVGTGTPGGGIVEEAFRWTAGTGMVGLGDLPGGGTQSAAFAISADGSTIVGRDSGFEGFRWTASDGMLGLGGFPGEPVDSIAFGVSADGSVVVGAAWRTFLPDGGLEAFLWTEAGMLDLGRLPGAIYDSFAYAVTPTGSVVVGQSSTGLDTSEAFRWTQGTGMVGLGNLPGGNFSAAVAISSDGSVIVGLARDAIFQDTAVIWFSDGSGPRALQDVLVADYGLDLTGWTLYEAAGISADGLTIVGTGTNPSGHPEGWIAVIPEPSTALLLALGLAGLALRRRLGV